MRGLAVHPGLIALLRSLSPRSSGERATASGAVSAGSNPVGGTAQRHKFEHSNNLGPTRAEPVTCGNADASRTFPPAHPRKQDLSRGSPAQRRNLTTATRPLPLRSRPTRLFHPRSSCHGPQVPAIPGVGSWTSAVGVAMIGSAGRDPRGRGDLGQQPTHHAIWIREKRMGPPCEGPRSGALALPGALAALPARHILRPFRGTVRMPSAAATIGSHRTVTGGGNPVPWRATRGPIRPGDPRGAPLSVNRRLRLRSARCRKNR